MQDLGAPSWASELSRALAESIPTVCLLCNWAVSAAARLQGNILGREKKMKACFSGFPMPVGKGRLHDGVLRSPSLLFISFLDNNTYLYSTLCQPVLCG